VAAERSTSPPDAFALHANYPNPFNPATTIGYDLPEAARVRLSVYDLFGREIVRLVDAMRPAGRHDVVFRGDHLASGTYLYRITAGAWTATRQLVLVK
jgi:hypothetical protein